MDLIERFESKFIPEPNSGCWLWTAGGDKHGYGRFRIGSMTDGTRRTAIAPRISWEIYRGPLPEQMNVLHCCDNPYCVNPDHLFLGTQTDNMQDCAKKLRTSKGERHSAIQKAHIPTGPDHPRYGKPGFAGETNGQAKLTDDQVRSIRSDMRTQAAIALDYGVAFQTISKIKRAHTGGTSSRAARYGSSCH